MSALLYDVAVDYDTAYTYQGAPPTITATGTATLDLTVAASNPTVRRDARGLAIAYLEIESSGTAGVVEGQLFYDGPNPYDSDATYEGQPPNKSGKGAATLDLTVTASEPVQMQRPIGAASLNLTVTSADSAAAYGEIDPYIADAHLSLVSVTDCGFARPSITSAHTSGVVIGASGFGRPYITEVVL